MTPSIFKNSKSDVPLFPYVWCISFWRVSFVNCFEIATMFPKQRVRLKVHSFFFSSFFFPCLLDFKTIIKGSNYEMALLILNINYFLRNRTISSWKMQRNRRDAMISQLKELTVILIALFPTLPVWRFFIKNEFISIPEYFLGLSQWIKVQFRVSQ